VGEVSDLEIKEMSLEEKYDKLYDSYILTDVIAMAFIMENGLTDEYLNYTMKVYKKMMPSIMDYAFKFIKTLSPGRAFKMFVEGILKDGQVTEPLSNTELVSLSGREEVIRTKNSVMLKKYRDIIKKTGVKLDLKEYFELFPEAGKEMVKEFGFDMTMDTSHIQEDEITSTIKLKK
jgi:hypothetical protein